MVKRCIPFRILVLGVLGATLSCPAWASDEDSKLKVTGFMSIVGGRVVGASLGSDYAGPDTIDGKVCPCYTADWSTAGVYREKLTLEPESRAGIQFKYTLSRDVNLVAQIVTRGADPKPDLQWAYGSVALDRQWEVQAGRKRIPLYFYSDYQDIGVSYPWVGVPPELYGWEVTNYNGASVRYKTSVGDTNVSASMFAGREKNKDALYMRLYYGSPTDVTWRKLVGGDIEAAQGALTMRAVYMQADVHSVNIDEGLDDKAALKAFGLAANLDFEDWFVLSELTQLARTFEAGYKVTAPAFTLGAGYRYGNWTPFVNVARYKEKSSDLNVYLPQSYDRMSLTVRYDLDARSALKFQADRNKDVTRNFGGDTTILRVAYDRLF
jgi:hypothetical protein